MTNFLIRFFSVEKTRKYENCMFIDLEIRRLILITNVFFLVQRCGVEEIQRPVGAVVSYFRREDHEGSRNTQDA